MGHDYDHCPACGHPDAGFDMPDVREEYFLPCGCGAKDCAECCETSTILVRIHRIWDRDCGVCLELTWRPEWQVVKDGKVVATLPSESAARAVVAVEWPEARRSRDPAWESERWLRIAETGVDW